MTEAGSADTVRLTLTTLPADIIRSIVQMSASESIDSMRLISTRWNSLVKDSNKMNNMRVMYTSLYHRSGLRPRIDGVFVESTLYRGLRMVDPSMNSIERPDTRVVREIQRCIKIDKLGLNIDKIYPDSFDTLRTEYLGKIPVRLLWLSLVQFFDHVAGRTILELMKSNAVQYFEASFKKADIESIRVFINDALTVVKSVKFYESHMIGSKSSSFYGRPQEYWEAFVQELNSKGTVYAEYHCVSRISENEEQKYHSYQLRLVVKAIAPINN